MDSLEPFESTSDSVRPTDTMFAMFVVNGTHLYAILLEKGEPKKKIRKE